MDEQLDHAPCGFLTLSMQGKILSMNQTLLNLLGYETNQLIGENINLILTVPARMFYQLYFVPLIKAERPVEEMYISLEAHNSEEIPVLINAVYRSNHDSIDCIIVPIQKRSEFENELLIAKKRTESALAAKRKANQDLEDTLDELEVKQAELIDLNEENMKFKIDTEKELRLARNIQETSLTEPIVQNEIVIDAYYKASSELSGDMYGFYQISPEKYGIMILDVMGHGISSALITMSLQSLFQRLILKGNKPAEIFEELDHHLQGLFQSNEETWHYCTAIYLFVDTNQQTVEYINAGHPPGIWQDHEGVQFELPYTNPPLGSFSGQTYKAERFSYNKGGRLLLYTDGVMDPFESHKLSSLFKKHPFDEFSLFKGKLLQLIKDEENGYHKNDDKCFILIDLIGRLS
ncbi:SpoIIE family protein phosphatase [Pseudalkalibacillus berkeleyi]|uniref:SpoIIE family protein phosphatase n=1 Tax=Pseudalkalibacillus berkeleyi TaxID=1069813 RepID=A0ABS9GY92_9BACL|nr:SpoIIE family protein phosphatase [Pseudalkalibacillus berkeleyi]MCF6137704.1 SpoIIE family protein phosphatase [Pseudalkalibacillus berkeleyi]